VSPFPALVAYALRAAVPPQRRIALLFPCVAAVLFGALSRGLHGDASPSFGRVAALALFGLVLPITALVVGDAVLGAEVRRGSFSFTWLSPVPGWQIVLARWVGGTVVAAGSCSLAFAIAALVAGTPDSVGPIVLAAALGSAAYIAVFMAIGCIATRAAVWSLAFVFLVERLLGGVLTGIAQLSPSWVARSAFVGMTDVSDQLHRDGVPEGGAAVVRLVLLTVIFLGIATWRIPKMKMASASD
jgi:ABC-type transport system involved in multi-copper enzyme maturation permease subunit